MPRLALFLLGPPRSERDGVPVTLDRRRTIALLAYLALTAQSHRRDSLVNLPWPDYDTARGSAALRRTLHAPAPLSALTRSTSTAKRSALPPALTLRPPWSKLTGSM